MSARPTGPRSPDGNHPHAAGSPAGFIDPRQNPFQPQMQHPQYTDGQQRYFVSESESDVGDPSPYATRRDTYASDANGSNSAFGEQQYYDQPGGYDYSEFPASLFILLAFLYFCLDTDVEFFIFRGVLHLTE